MEDDNDYIADILDSVSTILVFLFLIFVLLFFTSHCLGDEIYVEVRQPDGAKLQCWMQNESSPIFSIETHEPEVQLKAISMTIVPVANSARPQIIKRLFAAGTKIVVYRDYGFELLHDAILIIEGRCVERLPAATGVVEVRCGY